MRLLNHPAVGGVKSNLFLRGTSIRRGMSFFQQTQVLKDLSKDLLLVNEANVSLAGAGFLGCGEAIDAVLPSAGS